MAREKTRARDAHLRQQLVKKHGPAYHYTEETWFYLKDPALHARLKALPEAEAISLLHETAEQENCRVGYGYWGDIRLGMSPQYP